MTLFVAVRYAHLRLAVEPLPREVAGQFGELRVIAPRTIAEIDADLNQRQDGPPGDALKAAAGPVRRAVVTGPGSSGQPAVALTRQDELLAAIATASPGSEVVSLASNIGEQPSADLLRTTAELWIEFARPPWSVVPEPAPRPWYKDVLLCSCCMSFRRRKAKKRLDMLTFHDMLTDPAFADAAAATMRRNRLRVRDVAAARRAFALPEIAGQPASTSLVLDLYIRSLLERQELLHAIRTAHDGPALFAAVTRLATSDLVGPSLDEYEMTALVHTASVGGIAPPRRSSVVKRIGSGGRLPAAAPADAPGTPRVQTALAGARPARTTPRVQITGV